MLGYWFFGEVPTATVYVGSAIVAGSGPVRDLARAPARAGTRARARADRAADRRRRRYSPNALKVMIVRVSWMPGMICTFSFTKWPISVASST